MTEPVIDACVAIKWFIPEAGHESAAAVLYRYTSMIAPDLFFTELDAIISKKVRKREIELYNAEKLYTETRSLPIKIHEYKRISRLAFELSTVLPITQYDACYLALAIEFGQPLYTADQRFLNGMQKTPFSKYMRAVKD